MSDTDQQKSGLPALSTTQGRAGLPVIVPSTFEEAYRIAQVAVASGMAPDSMKTPQQCVVAIMHGMEVGLPPMAALQSIAVINGRPSVWGDGMLGLVQASGLLQDFDEHFKVEGDGLTAVCIASRRGRKSPSVGRFSLKDAKEAGLLQKKGPWQQYPRRMLQMRARGFALRDGFADVLKGLHCAEEMIDVTPGTIDGAATGPERQGVRPPSAPKREADAKPEPTKTTSPRQRTKDDAKPYAEQGRADEDLFGKEAEEAEVENIDDDDPLLEAREQFQAEVEDAYEKGGASAAYDVFERTAKDEPFNGQYDEELQAIANEVMTAKGEAA